MQNTTKEEAMSLFDAQIDERTLTLKGREVTIREAFVEVFGEMPEVAALRETAKRMDSPSPAMLLADARWDIVLAAMAASGFDEEQRLRVLMRATANSYADLHVYQPPDDLLEAALFEVDRSLVELACADFAGWEDANHGQKRKAGLAVVALGRHTTIPEELDRLVDFGLREELMREYLGQLSGDRRKAKVDELLMTEPLNRLNAFWRAELGVTYFDLLDEDQLARVRSIVDDIIAGKPDGDEDRVARLSAALDRGAFHEEDDWLERDEDGLTQYASNSLQYWIDRIAEERMRDQLGPLAESRVDVSIAVNAPELATIGNWCEATDERREEVARAVEAASGELGLTFDGFQTYSDRPSVPIAVFENEHTGMKVSLVPGGTYLRGFSEREEKLVVDAGEAAPKEGNWYETYQYLIDQAESMRPTAQVTVGPFLAFQMPSEAIEPAETTAMFEELPFRLLTEAEFEWLARGGRESELTWRGDDIPDEDWMQEVFDAGPSLRNPFGMAFLGMTPEALADVFVPNYDGAPTDGSARLGDGPRVTRGGAEMLFPWQACGEWQLLTNAVRTRTTEWEYFLAIRPAIGVRIA